MAVLTIIGALALLTVYLWHANRAISVAPPDLLKISDPEWTADQIAETYRKIQSKPIDVRPYLPAKKNRRYIVVGASGSFSSPNLNQTSVIYYEKQAYFTNSY